MIPTNNLARLSAIADCSVFEVEGDRISIIWKVLATPQGAEITLILIDPECPSLETLGDWLILAFAQYPEVFEKDKGRLAI